MHRHFVDRLTDTTAFRCLLLLSALGVLPILAMGALTTVIGGAAIVMERAEVDFAQAVFGLLSVGGVLGFLGYWRAHGGAQRPGRHNVTATLVCLAAGVVAALVVSAYALTGVLDGWRDPWDGRPWIAVPTLFAAANLVWALSGIAWMQRLPRRYSEKTGRKFDSLPLIPLLVALALALAAGLTTTAL